MICGACSACGTVVKIKPPHYTATQCFLLVNRRRKGFDKELPGEGLLVWRVDTKMEQVAPDKPAMLLVQADERHRVMPSVFGNIG